MQDEQHLIKLEQALPYLLQMLNCLFIECRFHQILNCCCFSLVGQREQIRRSVPKIGIHR